MNCSFTKMYFDGVKSLHVCKCNTLGVFVTNMTFTAKSTTSVWTAPSEHPITSETLNRIQVVGRTPSRQQQQQQQRLIVSFAVTWSPSLGTLSGSHRGRSPRWLPERGRRRHGSTSAAARRARSTRSCGSRSCSSGWERVGVRGSATTVSSSGSVLDLGSQRGLEEEGQGSWAHGADGKLPHCEGKPDITVGERQNKRMTWWFIPFESILQIKLCFSSANKKISQNGIFLCFCKTGFQCCSVFCTRAADVLKCLDWSTNQRVSAASLPPLTGQSDPRV